MMRILIIISLLYINCSSQEIKTEQKMEVKPKITKTEQEWKNKLTPEEYYVLREKGTERPHTGVYNLHFEEGAYQCKACGEILFDSDSKFESNCGWPSFDEAIEGKIIYQEDNSHGMHRTEIICRNCGSHLGHVFDDGPTNTGKRYCVNSLSLEFKKDRTALKKK